jgi:hypothetical protein
MVRFGAGTAQKGCDTIGYTLHVVSEDPDRTLIGALPMCGGTRWDRYRDRFGTLLAPNRTLAVIMNSEQAGVLYVL